MELKEVAVVSGKPGLYRIVKPAVNGVILEALDASKARFIVRTSTKVSVLGEISVYTENGDNIPLIEVFRTVHSKYGKTIELDPKQSDSKLREFFTELVPEHDKQRVYNSDIKKIIVWYNILLNNGFEATFNKKEEVSAPKTEEEIPSAPSVEGKKEKKSAAKKETSAEPVAEVKEDKKATKPTAKKGLIEQEGSEKKAGLDPAPSPEKKPSKTSAKKTEK